MARATFKMPEEFLLKLSKLSDRTDEILPKVLEAGAEVVKKKVRSNLASVIGKVVEKICNVWYNNFMKSVNLPDKSGFKESFQQLTF